MNILLIGYGKMGKAIETIAKERGHTIAGIIAAPEDALQTLLQSSQVDVAIEFTEPQAAEQNVTTCLNHGVPVVSGTTGWADRFEAIRTYCQEKQGTFFYASNFSLGVNLFFMLNEYMAKLMGTQGTSYQITVEETHHTEKKDAPSGTAISLAEGIIANHPMYKQWELMQESPLSENTLPIAAFRKPDVPGTHIIRYQSEIDTISIEHEAHSRKGFALGAVVAAEWVQQKKGFLTMRDLLADRTNF